MESKTIKETLLSSNLVLETLFRNTIFKYKIEDLNSKIIDTSLSSKQTHNLSDDNKKILFCTYNMFSGYYALQYQCTRTFGLMVILRGLLIITYLLFAVMSFSGCSSDPVSFKNKASILPKIEFNEKKLEICVIQTDMNSIDTAFINIENLYKRKVCIKDTIRFSVNKILKNLDNLYLVQKLANGDSVLSVTVKTTKSKSLTFSYTYKHENVNIKPRYYADVTAGNISALRIKPKKNYSAQIYKWAEKNKIILDTMIVVNMNHILQQLNHPGYYVYESNGNIPVLKTIEGARYRVKTNLFGKYFYLYAYNSRKNLMDFVKSKKGTTMSDASLNSGDISTCFTDGSYGLNTMYLIGIDEMRNYEILPVGFVIIDNCSPVVTSGGYVVDYNQKKNELYNIGARMRLAQTSVDNFQWLTIDTNKKNEIIKINNSSLFKKEKTHIILPEVKDEIHGKATFCYWNCTGYDSYGYDMSFYVDISGDIDYITLGNRKIFAKDINNNEFINTRVTDKHVKNGIKISATDYRGNTEESICKFNLFNLTPVTYDYDYGNSYIDELEDRIEELEDRIEELENR